MGETHALSTYLPIYGIYSPSGLWPLFRFLNLYTVGRTPCTRNQPVTRPLPTHRTTQTQNKHKQKSMLRVGFELTIPVFEQAKTVHALDREATVIGRNACKVLESKLFYNQRSEQRMILKQSTVRKVNFQQ
jgi:hypothetical protein